MILYLIIFILLLEKPAKVSADHNTGETYLSANYSNNKLRGLFAVLVMLGHISLQQEYSIYSPIQNSGDLAVGMFFSLSGYGLMTQFIRKKSNYRNGFLWNRLVVSIIIPYFIFNVIYFIFYQIIGKDVSITDMLRSLIDGHPRVSNSWYMIAIIYFYLLFYIAISIFQSRIELVPAAVFIGCIIWIAVCYSLGYGTWWYNSCFAFPFGMLWALEKEKIDEFMQPHFWLKESAFLFLTAAFHFAQFKLPYIFGGETVQKLIAVLCVQCSVLCFTVFGICLGMRLQFRGKLLTLLGTCSLELYMIHGLWMQVFRNDSFYISSDIIYPVLVFLCASASAYLIHLVLNPLMKKMRH